ncbi:MAG TPA: SIMPL domain-containing protein [Candidatus Kapabacteria bacterium]|jgi:uncharacterized protein YggE|nr:SIMPL domain-containing protein [Candidatus Kapabacteria bacterium]
MTRILATLLLLLSVNIAQAQDKPTHIRTIEVLGEGEINVVPNEVVINLGVETTDLSLEKAKAENDKRVQQIIKTLRDAGIAERDIQTQRINIEPQYDYRPEGRQFLGFIVRRQIVATVRDIARLDEITSKTVTAGITSIFNYEYKSSDEKRYRQEARVKAVASAKEKADALAKELGLRVVKAYTVTEDDMRGGPIPMYRQMDAGATQNAATFALGEIMINSFVRVIFEVQ